MLILTSLNNKRGVFQIYMKKNLINDEITVKKVRLIDDKTNEVMDTKKALEYAFDKGLDLIQMSEDEVPVVKVLHAGDYFYKLKQEKKANDKKQRSNIVQVKEIQFSTDTQSADLNVKLKHAQRFIEEKKQVRIVMKVTGRLGSNKEVLKQAEEKLDNFVKHIPKTEYVQEITIQKNKMTCLVKPAGV